MKKLNGSEKQIKWAEQIRDTWINGVVYNGSVIDAGINGYISKKNQMIESDMEEIKNVTDEAEIKEINDEINIYKKEIALFQALKEKIETETEAAWFIDNKASNGLFFSKHVFSKLG